MKAELTIPFEQYGNIRPTVEGTSEEIVAIYREFAALIKVQPKGLSESEFRALYDKIAGGQEIQGDPGILEELNPQQRASLNDVRKWVKRTK